MPHSITTGITPSASPVVWFVDQLDVVSADAVRARSLSRAGGVSSIETNVIYGVARL